MTDRADLQLVEWGHFPSRARARAAIEAGLVKADGVVVRRPSQTLASGAAIDARAAYPWVSRGGVKLAAALDAFALDPEGLACLDVGASTGGFTDVLLARGARSVVAVDVGHGQFDGKLAADRRVRALEGFDARRLTTREVAEPPRAIVCDVSFISQTLILPSVLALAPPAAWLVSLVKPQFEVGRGHLMKGRVTDEAALSGACEKIRSTVEGLGWSSLGLIPSPIPGGDGAREFLYAARHG